MSTTITLAPGDTYSWGTPEYSITIENTSTHTLRFPVPAAPAQAARPATTCRHEWVNVGFATLRLACKHCGQDMSVGT